MILLLKSAGLTINKSLKTICRLDLLKFRIQKFGTTKGVKIIAGM